MQAARSSWPERRLVVVFQPHRYTRTRDLFEDFSQVLSEVDALVMLDVYPAGETPISGADGRTLCRSIPARGPVDPGVYFYSFVVDGLTISDPTNRLIHPSLNPSASAFVVPGSPPHFAQERDVPHGTVHIHRHRSKTFDDDRAYCVYTPPGYTNAVDRRYPVLYFHLLFAHHARKGGMNPLLPHSPVGETKSFLG